MHNIMVSGDYNSVNRNDRTKTIKALLSLYLIGHPIHLIRDLILKWWDI